MPTNITAEAETKALEAEDALKGILYAYTPEDLLGTYASIASKIFESVKQCLAKSDDYYRHPYQMLNRETKGYDEHYIFVKAKQNCGVPTILVFSTDESDNAVTLTLFVELLNRFCFNTLGEVYIGVVASEVIPHVKLVQVEDSDELKPFVEAGIKPFSPTSTASYDKRGYHLFKSWLAKPDHDKPAGE